MGYCHFSAKFLLITRKLACYPNNGISLGIIHSNQIKALSQNSKMPYTFEVKISFIDNMTSVFVEIKVQLTRIPANFKKE